MNENNYLNQLPLFLDEVLDVSQRRAKAIAMKRNKNKLKIGRAKAEKRMASPKKLEGRSRRHARKQIIAKLYGGLAKSDMSYAQRRAADTKLETQKARITRIAKKILPNVRRQEIDRKRS